VQVACRAGGSLRSWLLVRIGFAILLVRSLIFLRKIHSLLVVGPNQLRDSFGSLTHFSSKNSFALGCWSESASRFFWFAHSFFFEKFIRSWLLVRISFAILLVRSLIFLRKIHSLLVVGANQLRDSFGSLTHFSSKNSFALGCWSESASRFFWFAHSFFFEKFIRSWLLVRISFAILLVRSLIFL
jgi:hypothetical protein